MSPLFIIMIIVGSVLIIAAVLFATLFGMAQEPGTKTHHTVRQRRAIMAVSIIVGAAFGLIFGLYVANIGLGIGSGIAVGVAVGTAIETGRL